MSLNLFSSQTSKEMKSEPVEMQAIVVPLVRQIDKIVWRQKDFYERTVSGGT